MNRAQYFISCVSTEFRSYRGQLKDRLTTNERIVKVQEDLPDDGFKLLDRLVRYIRTSEGVVHIVGLSAGKCPTGSEVHQLLTDHPGLAEALRIEDRIPGGTAGELDACTISYTQWEALLAIYFRRPLFVYYAPELASAPDASTPVNPAVEREPAWSFDAEQAQRQYAHIQHIRRLGHGRNLLPIVDYRDLAIHFLNGVGAGPAAAGESPAVKWPVRPAELNYRLADREEEVAHFLDLVTGATENRIFLLHARSDSGKTVLLNTFEDIAFNRLQGLQVGKADLKQESPIEKVLHDLRAGLHGIGFQRFMREHERNSVGMMRTMFLEDLKESTEPVLILLDTYEQAHAEVKQWVCTQLLNHAGLNERLRVVVVGQSVPDPDEHPRWGGRLARKQVLAPIMEPQHWCRYSEHVLGKPVDANIIRQVLVMANGAPRYVHELLKLNASQPAP